MGAHFTLSARDPHDAQLVKAIADADHGVFEALMRRHKGKLFRVARAILKDDAEAEDARQDAYLDAYRHINDFKGDAQVGIWLTRIVINQAFMRLRRKRRNRVVVPFGDLSSIELNDLAPVVPDEYSASPLSTTLRAEIRRILERRIDELPVAFRTAFVMREVEGMTTQETADCLSIPAETRQCVPGCFGHGHCCAKRWRMTWTEQRWMCLALPVSVAIEWLLACWHAFPPEPPRRVARERQNYWPSKP